jgi:uncharacterized protein (DUF1810 family)
MNSEGPIIIVLGQSLNEDGSAPATLVARIEEAVEFVTLSDATCTLICTGGDPMQTGISEAAVMKQMLASHLNDSACILLEEESMNTLQNARNCVQLLEQFDAPEDASEPAAVHLITSEFHMPRALYIFEAVFRHLGANLKLIPRPAFNRCPTSSPAQDSNINTSTAIERLQGEERMIDHYLVQRFLPKHIPDMPIAPLPEERRQRALMEIRTLLAQAQADDKQQKKSPAQTPVLDAILAAQEGRFNRFPAYPQALREIKSGHKSSHWIWYVVPTMAGIRSTSKPQFHLPTIKAAQRYLRHELLAERLIEVSTAAMECMQGRRRITCRALFGSTDAKKFFEAMTFFGVAAVENMRQDMMQEEAQEEPQEERRAGGGAENRQGQTSRDQLMLFMAALASAVSSDASKSTGQITAHCSLDADAMRVVCAQTGRRYIQGGSEERAEIKLAGELLQIADSLSGTSSSKDNTGSSKGAPAARC